MTAGRRGYAYRVLVTELPDDWTAPTPRPRRFLSRSAANRRVTRLAEQGVTAHVQRSAPVVWPDARRERKGPPVAVVETLPLPDAP